MKRKQSSQLIWVASALLLTPISASAASSSHQLKPVLKAINPAQAKVEPLPSSEPRQPSQAMQQPAQVPQSTPVGSAQAPYPPGAAPPMGPSWGPGYAPAQTPPVATLQAPNGADDPRLAKLEQIAFGSTYPEHENDDRVEHLEREVFGKVNQGDYESRVQKLELKLGAPSTAFGVAPARQYPPQQRQYPPAGQQAPPAFAAPPQSAYSPPPAQPAYLPPQQYQQLPADMPQLPAWSPPAQAAWPGAQQPAWGTTPAQPVAYGSQQQPDFGAQQPPQYQPPPPQQYSPTQTYPSQPFNPPPYQQQPAFATPPPTIPQGPVTMQSFNRQPAMQAPVQPPMQAPVQPTYQSPIAPEQPMSMPVTAAPATIPQGPVTMRSFNRPQPSPMAFNPPVQAAPVPPPTAVASPPTQPVGTATANPANATDINSAVLAMPFDPKAGDYSSQLLKLGGGFPRWTTLPVRVHIPMNTPDNWKLSIDAAVKKWKQYLPVTIAPANEPADIEIGWINHLMPRQLGITNLEIFNGKPRVTIYLLRPNYYPPDVPEKALQQVATHEIGHGLGIFGHSSNPADIMAALDAAKAAKVPTISQRDINTLRRVYQSTALPDGFQSPQPISWP